MKTPTERFTMELRTIIKFAIRTIIQHGTAKLTADAIKKSFPDSETGIVPPVAGSIFGYVVSEQAGARLTDPLVDKIMDRTKK